MKIDASKLRALAKSHGLSNTKLAAEAGITRQALQTMFRQTHPVEVRDRTVKGLVKALRLGDESLLSPDPLGGYKEAVADEHADLAFRGLGLPTTEPKSMDEVYVPIRVSRTPESEGEEDCRPSAAAAVEEAIEESDGLSFADSLVLHRRILVCGEPGSGKTTMLRHAARANARGLVVEGGCPKQSRVPLVVRLADFAKARERDSDMSLVRFVVTQALPDAPSDYWSHVEQHIELELQRGACLVLFDGLDEVGSDNRLATLLRHFVDDFGRNQFVVTSRIVGLDVGPWRKLGFAAFQVARWREEDIREFARRWYAARPAVGKRLTKKHDPRAEELTAAILGHRQLRAIASNPLMLTILAALHHARATLPRRRVDLYSKIVEVMLETWEASKRVSRPGDPLHRIVLEAREFAWLLERLALGMQREGRVLRPRWWVNECLQQFLREQMALDGDLVKEQGERVLRYLCERTGLLVERGDGIFGFCHPTFQEYFAARALLLEVEGGGDIVALLRPYLFHPQWEEVVVHVAALLAAPRATSLLRVILDDSDPAGRFLRRGQRLALRCLVDGTAVADRALIDQIFSDGETIGRSRWLAITFGFKALLNQLLATRHETEAEQMLRDIENGAKKSLPQGEYLALYLSSHDPPDEPRNGTPGTVCQKRLGGHPVELVRIGWRKRIENPDAWYAEVLKAVRNPKTELLRRIVLISILGRDVDSNVKAQRALKDLLERDESPQVRAECAEALENVVSGNSDIAKLLLDRLNKDKSDLVRQRCAEALRSLAPHQAEVRDRLEELFASGPELVRAGAVKGLSRLDFVSPDRKALLDRILATVTSPAEPTKVRQASVWAIASLVGRDEMTSVTRIVEECLGDDDLNVRGAALHALADAIAEGRGQGPQLLVEKIESTLMAATDPCPHLYGALVTIVAMKEMDGGRRRERVLEDALRPFGELIRLAFVFGSVARLGQIRESDIDLMVVGDVRLKDLAGGLHLAEQTLGRTVNPVLFSPDKFRDQYREGNPLLLDVVRKDKIFLKGSPDELTELVAERSVD